MNNPAPGPPDSHLYFHDDICRNSVFTAKPAEALVQGADNPNVSFVVKSYRYIISVSGKPNRKQRVIRLFGATDVTPETNAYLIFTDDPQQVTRVPVYKDQKPDAETVYIFYPTAYMSTVEDMLKRVKTDNPDVVCLYRVFDDGHTWASIEADGP